MDKSLGKNTRIAMVGYHNTLPFLYGLEKAKDRFDLILDIPSRCMDYFKNNAADIALVPIATIINDNNVNIITDYCIGCDGHVETVGLFANQEIRNLHTIYLDSDSRTSQLLTKILIKHHWYQQVDFIEMNVRQISSDKLKDGEGVLMIGDKAFNAQSQFKHFYDLGQEWKMMTGLPFAFAVWISKINFPKEPILELESALSLGVEDIPAVLAKNESLLKAINLEEYFQKHIDFDFDSDKKKAVELYFELAQEFV